jgi:energy-dependent translational throttle protein EttA
MAQYVYTMNRVGKIVPPKKQILKDISLSFFPGAKIGMLGLNGSGKSTVLKIMAGVDKEIEGEATRDARASRSATCRRNRSLDPEQTVREAVEEGIGGVLAGQEASWTRSTPPMPSRTPTSTRWPPSRPPGGDRRRRQREHRPAARDRRRRAAPAAVGGEDRHALRRREAPRRAVPLLLSKPDMLLLDEPTNHLDAESVEWLEQFLARFPGTVVAVTHDRYFLDNAAEWILELDRGRGIPWKGNYSEWLVQKGERLEQEESHGGRAQKAMKKELEWVRQNPKGRQAKSKARLARFEELQTSTTRSATRPTRSSSRWRAPGQRGHRVQERHQELRRPPADRRPQLQGAGRRDRRHHRPQRRRQVDAVPMIRASREARQRRGEDRPHREAWPSSTRAARAWAPRRRCSRTSPAALDNIVVGKFEMPSRAYIGRFNFKGNDQQKLVGNAVGRRARPPAPGQDAAAGRQRAAARRAVQRPRRRDAARARRRAARVPRLRDGDQPRPLVPRPHRHAHPGLRGRLHVEFFNGNYREYEEDKKRRLGEEGARRTACATRAEVGRPRYRCAGSRGVHNGIAAHG